MSAEAAQQRMAEAEKHVRTRGETARSVRLHRERVEQQVREGNSTPDQLARARADAAYWDLVMEGTHAELDAAEAVVARLP